MTANDIVGKYFKSNQGLKTQLKTASYVKKIEVWMSDAQIELLNMHDHHHTITEKRRAELVKSGNYHGQLVNS